MSGEARLPTSLWVDGHLRQLNARGVPYYIVHKGAYASGTVLLKLNGLENGSRLLGQVRDMDGNLGWMAVLGDGWLAETEVDAYIRRAVDRDPDVWVVEIEDRSGENPFEGKTVT
jgi:hypothetical protein